MHPPLDELLDCAIAAARTAGSHALQHADRRTDIDKATRHDIKLHLDRECQEAATAVIQQRYPSHAILGEEDAEPQNPPADTSLEWVIDPIDGTVNFFHGLPIWCSSVAVRSAEQSLAGVVFAPESDLIYAATADTPSTVNNVPIQVSGVDQIDEALLLTGLNQKHDGDLLVFDAVQTLSERVRKTRVLGAAALDMCRVAQGHAEAYWEAGIYTWDIAAAELIVRQAGGRTTTLKKLPEPHRMSFLATNSLLHDAFKDIIRVTA